MRTYYRNFKALLWKEYREAKPVYWLILSVSLVFLYVCVLDPILAQRGSEHQADMLMILERVLFPLPLILGFLFYLPLLSREPERDTLVAFRTKPISPEQLGLFNWLAAFILAGSILFLFVLGFEFGFAMKEVHREIGPAGYVLKSNFWWLMISIFIWMVGWGLGILAVSGFFFYTISAATGNRIRSLGLLMVLGTVLWMAYSAYTRHIFFSPEGDWLSRSYILFTYQTALVLAVLILFLAVLMVWTFRLRLTGSLHRWPIYSGVMVGMILVLVFCIHYYTGNRNITELRIDPMRRMELVGHAIAFRFGSPLEYSAFISTTNSNNRSYIYNGMGYMVTGEAEVTGYSVHDIADSTEPVNLAIQKPGTYVWEEETTPRPEIVLSRPLRNLFRADSWPENSVYEQYHVWTNPLPWYYRNMTAQGGLVSNGFGFSYDLLHEYIKRTGANEEEFQLIWKPYSDPSTRWLTGLSKEEQAEYFNNRFADFKKFAEEYTGEKVNLSYEFERERHLTDQGIFFLGHYSLQEPFDFTPVKTVEISFPAADGYREYTVEAQRPGVFQEKDFNSLWNRDEKEEIRYLFTGLMHFWMDDFSVIGTDRNLAYRIQPGDDFSIVIEYDLRDPEHIHVRSHPFLRDSSKMPAGAAHHYPWLAAVHYPYLYSMIEGNSEDYLSVLDVSDMKQVKEIQTLAFPNVHAFKTPFSKGIDSNRWRSIFANDEKLVLHDRQFVYVFDVSKSGRVDQKARIVNPRVSNEIERCLVAGNEILLVYNDQQIERYGLGDVPREMRDGQGPIYLTDTADYKARVKTIFDATDTIQP